MATANSPASSWSPLDEFAALVTGDQLRLQLCEGGRARRGARHARPPCRCREGGRVGSASHIVVACAGVLDANYPVLTDTMVEDFDAMFAVNVRRTFLVCSEAANRVPAHSGGRVW
ncbi:hypothetical protein PR202_ga00392 [Eleusine coracana subsp. coracana]|uniref:Uncharacterized protein n=1 Tax=Eleusine coracana subsp. coracana TaxID=191504 RepID=A0AAV5BHC3_ELECO|nr:hypothetical protein PR202_ga00392 [Eleusine coracana subsp. coracana]